MLVPALCLITGFCLGVMVTTLRLVRRFARDIQRLEARVRRLDRGQHAVDHVAFRNTRDLTRTRGSLSDIVRTLIDIDKRLRSTEVIHTEIIRSLPPPASEFEEEERPTQPFPWGPDKR